MKDELLACPFCGGPGEMVYAGPYCWVDCPDRCYPKSKDNVPDAIAAWNRRDGGKHE